MKMPVILVSLFVITCLFGFSCKKWELPPASKTGEGTMGFIIDGKTWIAHSDDFKLSQTGARYWTSYGLVIYGVNQPKSHLDIILKNPKTGTYQFTTDDLIEYKLYDSPTVYSLDITDPSNSLLITRCDDVISGKFSFKLKSPNGAMVTITSGRFDIPIDR